MVLSYYHNAQNTTGAQHIRTLLNQARQIAIDQKTFVCVQVSAPSQMSFYLNTGCTGTPWLGPITDAAGNITLQPGFTVSASASPVFDYLGRSLPEAYLGFDAHRLRLDLRPTHDSLSAAARAGAQGR